MIQLLIKTALRDGDPTDPAVRQRCGTVSGLVGICLNLILCLGKLGAGIITGSVAMIADGINNLSDAASSVVTLIGFRLAGRKASADRPFGSGRIEYLSGLVVALAILLMGVELGRSALEALFRQTETEFSVLAVVILCAAIAVKLWMFLFNRKLGRTIGSAAMEATAADSLSDTLSTGVVLLSALAARFLNLRLDGAAGLLVAIFILKTGLEAAKDTLDPLLGRPMDPALAEDINKLACSYEGILGIHDLVYHDYGPGRAMMSFHAEVPADGDFLALHDLIDQIEQDLREKHHILASIHMDPVVRDGKTGELREKTAALARTIDPVLTIHDFRITPGPERTNLIFDVVAPFGFRMSDEELREAMKRGVKEMSERYYAVIQVDHSYVEKM